MLRALSSFIAQLRDQLNGTSNTGTVKNPVLSGAATGSLSGVALVAPTISGTPAISSTAVTWSGNPTHSGDHTFSGAIAGGYLPISFTPWVSFGALSVGVSYNPNRGGAYILVGKFVYFCARLRLTSKGSSTGTAAITGLPFPMSSSSPIEWPCSVTALSMTGLTGAMTASCGTASSNIVLGQWGATGVSTLTDAQFTNTSDVNVCGFYPIT